MTAINIMRTPDAVHMFYDTRGTVGDLAIAQVAKCMPIPHIHAAVATRGHAQVLHVIAGEMSQHSSYDDMKAGIVRRMKNIDGIRRVSPQWADLLETEFDAFFIGWGKNGPDAFAVFSHSNHGYPAHQILDIGPGIITPMVPQEALERISDIPDINARAIAALSLQGDLRPDIVGGHMIQTVIDRDGVRSRCLGPFPARKQVGLMPWQHAPPLRIPEAFSKREGIR